MSNGYGNDSIRSLSEKDKVRLNPANILGADNVEGCFHCFIEVADNSLDELKAGYGDKIEVKIHKDGYYSVEDFGRGVPMAWNEREQRYNYELVYMQLYSGGKYEDKKSRGYTRSKGTYGLGASAAAFSSEEFYVRSYRDGHKYELLMREGDLVEFKEAEYDYERTGTYIKWKPSKQVFTETVMPTKWILEYSDEQAIVNSTTFNVDNELDEQKITYSYQNGIKDYIVKLSKEKEFTTPQYLEFKATGRDIDGREEYDSEYEIAFCFNNEEAQIKSYHNSSYLKEGGSPHDGIRNAFTYCIDKLIKDQGKYTKNEKKLSFEDISDSLLVITSTYSTKTSYKNQTKFAITNEFIKNKINEKIRKYLEVYFIENPIEAEKIVTRCLINKRSRERAERTRVDAVKQLSKKISNSITRPEKFLPCRSKDKNEVELIVIEGDSAMNSVKNSRNSKIQCVIPVKGKSLNVIKSTLNDILKNKEIRDIFQILECGMEYNGKPIKGIKKFNIDDLSVNKIIIFSDEDEDGMHVRSLIIAIIKILAPQIIDNGHLYVLESPLYKIENGKDLHLVYSEKEKNDLLRTLTGKVNVQRFKGLGGLNSSMLSKTAMHPENRRLTQITMEDAIKSTKIMEMFMDKAVEDRKAFIQENGDKYFDFSIYE
ncbi:toprim domain-containing protein [Priestia aryabhattai]|uniref:toprim domain-containing protein n=1 Tax=Priestia aryabhattai TaxID=412384 RepID=UPI0015F581F7|nr:toprim domain-containing protein [Priestia aryabhattai]